MKLFKVRNAAIFLGTLVLAASALSGCGAKQQADDPNAPVRIANFPNITHSQALVARANQAFQKEIGDKNKVEWLTFNAGPAEVEALFAGAVDIGYIGPGPAINGYVKSNGALKIIAGATESGAILVSRKDLRISSVKELDGKKVAVPQYGNTQDLALRNLLKKSGLKDTAKGGTVEIVQAENPDIKALLDKGNIDAALVPEPWGSRLVDEVGANVVLESNQIFRNGNYSSAVVVARTEFIEKHPELVESFVRAHVKLTDTINSNKVEARGIVNSQIKSITKKSLSQGVLDSSFKRLKVTYDPQKDSVIELAAISNEFGFSKEKVDSKGLFDLSFLNKVLRESSKNEIK